MNTRVIITGRFKNSKLDPIKTYCNLTTADTPTYNNDTSDEALDDEEEAMDICKGLDRGEILNLHKIAV